MHSTHRVHLAQGLPIPPLARHQTWRFQQVTSSPTINQEPSAVTPQNQHSGRLQHISYAEAVRKYPVLDCADKSGSAAAA
ncbi:hypothetical protein J6590_107406 [Homalodisca vitripennis]|nr:hypothetical protein J6590_107406 [Homalodisca vitripennis]